MNKKLVMVLVAALATMSFAYRVGVLKSSSISCSEEITIKLDTEDTNGKGQTKLSGPDQNAPGISLSASVGGNVTFTYCVVDLQTANSASFDYVMLRLDSYCPKGTYSFYRKHDCEDKNNANSKKGKVSPNVIDKNAVLEYCFVPATSSTPKYPFRKTFGVFANPSTPLNGVSQYSLYVDDENSTKKAPTNCEEIWRPNMIVEQEYNPETDSFDYIPKEIGGEWEEECDYVDTKRNLNEFGFRDKGNGGERAQTGISARSLAKRVRNIVEGDQNTTYHIVKWNGSALNKSASMSDVPAVAAEDFEAPLATGIEANIKSVTRENIGVELQTAGDVEISVVGFNGRSFASFTAKNLQPGFNSINWNSTSVPNGHYIVSVKQNGMTRGINVKLK